MLIILCIIIVSCAAVNSRQCYNSATKTYQPCYYNYQTQQWEWEQIAKLNNATQMYNYEHAFEGSGGLGGAGLGGLYGITVGEALRILLFEQNKDGTQPWEGDSDMSPNLKRVPKRKDWCCTPVIGSPGSLSNTNGVFDPQYIIDAPIHIGATRCGLTATELATKDCANLCTYYAFERSSNYSAKLNAMKQGITVHCEVVCAWI